MNWAWATSLDYIWRSPAFPMWLTMVAAGFFGIIALITLLRADKSMANGALTVITLLAIGIAVAATIRGFGPQGRGAPGETQSPAPMTAALPALSCIDDMAGETVLTACEKGLFGSPEAAAAALSYAAAMISRVTAAGDVATANANMTADLQMERRAVERDRYGLMAYVLAVRDHCTPSACFAYRSLTDSAQIGANMGQGVYESLIAHYAPSWNAPAPAPAPGPVSILSPGATGKPTNAEFPSAASTPPVSIMTPEPGTSPAASSPHPTASTASVPSPSPPHPSAPTAIVPQPPPSPRPAASPAVAAAKKKPVHAPTSVATPAPAPVPAPAPTPAPTPAAAND
jgi:hypothetical protein